MYSLKKWGIFLSLSLISSITYSFEEIGKVSEPLPEMTKPTFASFGSRYYYHNNVDSSDNPLGEAHVDLVINDDETMTLTASSGCTWKRSDRYAPASYWENCGGNSGSQGIVKRKGDIWPLKLKRKFSYTVKNGQNNRGATWSDYVRCKVKGAVRVKTQTGEYDTYKLVCSGKYNTKTWYIAPELGHEVAYKRVHKRRGLESDQDWLRWGEAQ